MKKNFILLTFGLGIAASACLAVVCSNSSPIGAFGSDDSLWRHYEAVQATETSNGCREYWINCTDHEISYTDPGKTDEEATHTDDFLSTLSDKDPRYTAYTPNAFANESNFLRYFRVDAFGTATDYSNGIVSSAASATINYSLISDAHELDYKYIYFNVDATTKENTSNREISSIVIYAENTTGKFSTGNSWLQENLPTGITIDVDNFYGKYNGDGYKDGALLFNMEVRDAKNTTSNDLIENLIFSNFKLFKDETSLNAYKKMTTLVKTNGYDYFKYGILVDPQPSNKEISFKCGDKANFTISNKLVSDMKTAGCSTFSFNIKASSSDGAELTHAVFTTHASGTNANGESISWSTDWNDIKVASKEEMANSGVRVTLNVSKLFGDEVNFTTSDNVAAAYDFEFRLDGQYGKYTSSDSSNTVLCTVSDIIVK